MRIEKSGQEPFFIHESIAIVEHFEELFGKEKGYVSIFGETPEQRAKTRDILSLLADATTWSTAALVHGNKSTLFWSGMKEEDMSMCASRDAKRRFDNLLSKLEDWVYDDVIRKETKSLTGEGADVTLADPVLMAAIMYSEDSYGKDWVEDHGVLRVWCERAKKETWFVGRDELKRCESQGWIVVLGE